MSSFEEWQNWENSKVAFLPIKPVYAERLLAGTKHFEYRRRPMSADVTHIVVYASSPAKRIVGIVKVSEVQSGSVRSVWNRTKEVAGITRADYFEYFAGSDTAYAIAIDPSKTVRFDRHIAPAEIEKNFVVPQSFRYVDSSFMKALLAHS